MDFIDLQYGLQKNKDGKYVIYPFSKYGKGYIVTSKTAGHIRKYVDVFMIICSLIFCYLAYIKFIYFVIAIPVGLMVYILGLYSIVKDAPISNDPWPYENINKNEYFNHFACRQGIVKSIILLVIGILFVIGSIVIFIVEPSERLLSVGCFILFGFGLWVQIKIVRCLLKNKSKRYNKSSKIYNGTT